MLKKSRRDELIAPDQPPDGYIGVSRILQLLSHRFYLRPMAIDEIIAIASQCPCLARISVRLSPGTGKSEVSFTRRAMESAAVRDFLYLSAGLPCIIAPVLVAQVSRVLIDNDL
jgi:hypothetical protein